MRYLGKYFRFSIILLIIMFFSVSCTKVNKFLGFEKEPVFKGDIYKTIEKHGFKAVSFSEVDAQSKALMAGDQNKQIIDIRPIYEYSSGHIPGAVPLVQGEVLDWIKRYPEVFQNRKAQFIIYAEDNKTLAHIKVARALRDLGYKKPYIYAGGMAEWSMYTASAVSDITAKELLAFGKAIFIDVRTEELYSISSIPSSVNIPIDSYEEFKKRLPEDLDGKYVIYSQEKFSADTYKFAEKMISERFNPSHIFIYENGFAHWSKKGFPVFTKPIAGSEQVKDSKLSVDGIMDSNLAERALNAADGVFALVFIGEKAIVEKSGMKHIDVLNEQMYQAGGCPEILAGLDKAGNIMLFGLDGSDVKRMYSIIRDDCGFANMSQIFFTDKNAVLENNKIRLK